MQTLPPRRLHLLQSSRQRPPVRLNRRLQCSLSRHRKQRAVVAQKGRPFLSLKHSPSDSCGQVTDRRHESSRMVQPLATGRGRQRPTGLPPSRLQRPEQQLPRFRLPGRQGLPLRRHRRRRFCASAGSAALRPSAVANPAPAANFSSPWREVVAVASRLVRPSNRVLSIPPPHRLSGVELFPANIAGSRPDLGGGARRNEVLVPQSQWRWYHGVEKGLRRVADNCGSRDGPGEVRLVDTANQKSRSWKPILLSYSWGRSGRAEQFPRLGRTLKGVTCRT